MTTPRQRLLTCLRGDVPDCVPVAPDFSNMIPARLTGKPFWDLYLYNDPPIWEAYIDCAKRFDIDSLMDGYFPYRYDWPADDDGWETFIVFRNEERIVTQTSRLEDGKRRWRERVTVYYRADPPTEGVEPAKVGLPPVPQRFEPLEGVKPVDLGPEGLRHVKEQMGEQGLVGVFVIGSCLLHNEEDIYRAHDDPGYYERLAETRIAEVDRRMEHIAGLEVKPDFICVGGSGTLVYQTVDFFRTFALPAVRRACELAAEMGIPSQLHSCGPETKLVEILAAETKLTIIDPLEIPPMGDCDLADLKRRFGERIVLKGNLHTTNVMLRGSADDVAAASRQAIDDAGAGGRFVLSTGDQCGRDTPDENLRAMVETARTYGRYRPDGTIAGAP
jgi:uroporphyrinogen decarboxylase